MKAFLRKEWLLAQRRPHDLLQPLFFIFILLTLFALAVGGEAMVLQKIAAAVIWIAALLAVLLAAPRYFQSDYDDGSLTQFFLSGHNPLYLVVGKVIVQWGVQILPLLLTLPLLGVFYGLPWSVTEQIALTLLIGSPSLLLLAMLGAALTLSLQRGAVLLMLLILPLYLPTLLFALLAVSSFVDGFANTGQLAMLGAVLMLTLVVVPFATVAALRVALSGR